MNKVTILTPEKAGHNLVAGSDTKRLSGLFYLQNHINSDREKKQPMCFPTSQKAISSNFTIRKICLVYFI